MRVLIVDDEPPARAAIRKMLRAHLSVEVAGECQGGAEASRAIAALAPDVVFLDVQMPEVDGFAVLEAVTGRMPYVVFVTAYDRYAVRAFEVQALDYLLKPFDRERFDAVLERARLRLAARDWEQRLAALCRETGAEPVERFLIRDRGRVRWPLSSPSRPVALAAASARRHGSGHSTPRTARPLPAHGR